MHSWWDTLLCLPTDCRWFVCAELCQESSCVVWECLFGFAYFWWCFVYYLLWGNYCLHVVCDDLRVYLCNAVNYTKSHQKLTQHRIAPYATHKHMALNTYLTAQECQRPGPWGAMGRSWGGGRGGGGAVGPLVGPAAVGSGPGTRGGGNVGTSPGSTTTIRF